jgi:geranylgeranyl diphosphate synthase, type II
MTQMQELEKSILEFKTKFNEEFANDKNVGEEEDVPQILNELVNAIFQYAANDGKRLRPYLLNRINTEFGNSDLNLEDALFGFEILHNSTLIADDVLDGHLERRGKPTLLKTYKNKGYSVEHITILASYMMFNMGLEMIAGSELPTEIKLKYVQAYNEISASVNMGQVIDLNQRGKLDISEKNYINKIRATAATFIAKMFYVGAKDNKDKFEDIGYDLGIIFQLADDLMDVNSKKRKGRDLGSDIRMGTPTLLSIYTYQHLEGSDQRLFGELFGKEDLNGEDLDWMIEKYQKTGAVVHVQEEIEKYQSKVHEGLKDLKIEEPHWLYDLCDYAHQRTN